MKKFLLPLIATAFLLVSCKGDLTSLNKDPKSPATVPGEPLFTNAEFTLGNYLNDPSYNRNPFLLYAQYWAETTYSSESRYELTTRQIPSTLWEDLYTNVLKDLDQSKKIIQNDKFMDKKVKQNKVACINILEALTYSDLVNIFGNVPYGKALNIDNTLPKYDDAETIYMDLLSRLNTAIGNLDTSAEGFGDADIYYQGDISKWIKFANS
ncbi:MAG TPA: SusD/RagB family nutrient-binding outer membrane lipoprotein, partial [Balneolaceae bacterium]|nr:SusD/RagB family nutrient-binding outer membrane lipoprotein [Balneolaceae bacterium]